MKKCYKCKQIKSLQEFSKNSCRKDGLSSHCKSCHSMFRRQHYERNKDKIYKQVAIKREEYKKWYNSLKNKPCTDCGKSYPPYVMDFDHLDSNTKEFKLSKTLNYGWGKKRVFKEITKCELVCANCHRERTYKRLHASLA
jgi:hypothetical protein